MYLVISLEPVDGRKAFDRNSWHIYLIGNRIHFDDSNIVIALYLLTKTVPDRGKCLAVAAPDYHKSLKSVARPMRVREDVGDELIDVKIGLWRSKSTMHAMKCSISLHYVCFVVRCTLLSERQ